MAEPPRLGRRILKRGTQRRAISKNMLGKRNSSQVRSRDVSTKGN
jgi:hypothetical protein